MMSFFQSMMAVLLTFLIVSPVCCCSVSAANGPAKESCCLAKAGETGEKRDDKVPHICACKTKEPKEISKDLVLPGSPVGLLSPVAQDLSGLLPPAPIRLLLANTPHSDCDPPRLLLARYSRWLI